MSDYDRDFKNFQNQLPVMKHRLDDELEVHPQVYEMISSRVVLLNSQMLEAKNQLAMTEDRLTEDARDSGSKLTKDEVEGRVRRHPDRKAAWIKFQAARAEHERWVGLLDAWRQKGYAIKTLAELYTASYYVLGGTSVVDRTRDHSEQSRRPTPRSSIRNGDQIDEGRAALRRASNQVSLASTTQEEARPRRRALINGD